MMKVILAVLIVLFMSVSAHATTMGSCSQSALETAISETSAGGVVYFPEADCALTGVTAISLTKAITLTGRGYAHSSITGSGQIFTTSGEGANGFRVTGIQFNSCQQCFYLDGTGTPKQAVKDFRIDNCKFSGVNIAFETDGQARGVLDNNVFYNSYGARIYGSNGSETFPFTMGNNDAVFFEDNTITVTSGQNIAHFIASNSGSKYVVRHNSFDYSSALWDIIDAHGYCEVAGRGSYTFEVYSNTFNLQTSIGRIMRFRGGQGLVYSNSITGTSDWPIVLTDLSKCDTGCIEDCTSYPCKDQINHTYLWSNTKNGSAVTTINDCADTITLNTDYTNSAMSGYSAYTYPHPLRGEGAADTTAPSVTITTSGQTITSDSLTVEGTASDAVGVSSCKYRIGSAPDASNGTACTGTTSWSCSTSGYSSGANTLYVGCGDAAGNWGSSSITVTYNPPAASATSSISGGTIAGGVVR